jgi:putative sigma-54 modulation protein
MLNKRIKITGMDMTPSIQDYVHKKVDALVKFIDNDTEALAEIEIGRITNHHHKGDVYKAEINLTIGKNIFRADVTESDLYTAIDMMKDRVMQEVSSNKDKNISLFKKGQKILKDMLKRG